MRLFSLRCLAVFLSVLPYALAQIPQRSTPQTAPIALIGATIHIGDGSTVIEDGTIIFDKGLITAIGKRSDVSVPAGTKSIQAVGKHIYPGFIASNSILGLSEIQAVRSTNDFEETGGENPHARALVAYNTDSHIIPTIRFNGVLSALTVPQGGMVAGTSSLMALDGWNWEDAVIAPDVAMHITWTMVPRLKSLFADAKSYISTPQEKKNLKLEAMRGVLAGTRKLVIEADDAKAILQAIAFTKEYGITPIILGGAESWLIADDIKKAGVAVILRKTHRLPYRTGDAADQPFRVPAQLYQAGVQFCLGSNGSWQQRNLPFEAGTAVAHGLTKEQALCAITLNVAKIFGVAKTMGSLELGKDATLFISTGDALDMLGNNVEYAFIRGRTVDLMNKQKFLYDQYIKKYQRN
jgi:imidazolonepropionase-like amidohydrolase